MDNHCRALVYAALAVVMQEFGHPLACAASVALCVVALLRSLA